LWTKKRIILACSLVGPDKRVNAPDSTSTEKKGGGLAHRKVKAAKKRR